MKKNFAMVFPVVFKVDNVLRGISQLGDFLMFCFKVVTENARWP